MGVNPMTSVLPAVRQAGRHSQSLRAAPLRSVAHEVEADDPGRNRCGCFLPDLTRLATAPPTDFRGPYGGRHKPSQAPQPFIKCSRDRHD